MKKYVSYKTTANLGFGYFLLRVFRWMIGRRNILNQSRRFSWKIKKEVRQKVWNKESENEKKKYLIHVPNFCYFGISRRSFISYFLNVKNTAFEENVCVMFRYRILMLLKSCSYSCNSAINLLTFSYVAMCRQHTDLESMTVGNEEIYTSKNRM